MNREPLPPPSGPPMEIPHIVMECNHGVSIKEEEEEKFYKDWELYIKTGVMLIEVFKEYENVLVRFFDQRLDPTKHID